ncbi:MAG TPA: penicillin acylase family protein [Solirubrobacteraceae bacterium]|nr:penicillin acylase family protein [Solirubrobacteraceae bacterium]
MLSTPRALAGLATALLSVLAAAPAQAKDYAPTALNIIPSGQYGGLDITPDTSRQAQMYDGLTPLFDNVTTADLFRYFKSEALGLGSDGPGKAERVPRKGVRIVRDSFDVPHITGATRDDVTWAMGWVLEEDRALLLQQARYPARLSALDAPNTPGFPLVVGLKAFTPSKQADAMIDRAQTSALRHAGREGRALLHDIDVYVQGINARLRFEKSKVKPWTRVDVYAVNALLGELFGRGGGDEVHSAMLLDGLDKRLGPAPGRTVWNDLTESQDPETPTTLTKRFPYGAVPSKDTGNAIVDDGSFKPWLTAGSPRTAPARAAAADERVPHMSNFLMVGAQRSTTGHPLFVAGPQIGYFYPGLTLEMDVKGPGFEARGATSATNPGSILIGRGPDYAWSLTSAGSDVVDEYAETLCGAGSTRYRFNGRCLSMGRVNAGRVGNGPPIVYRTTVHGPVVGYATVHGRRVAIASKRSSYGRDILFELPFRELTLNQVTSPKTFYAAMAKSPFTFNAAYADDRHIAMYSGGALPLRPKGVDPRLPTIGDGRFEWRGFLAASKHAHGADPASGVMVNWNNKPAPGFAAADDNFSYGSIQRVQMLANNLAARQQHDLASVTGAMNKAATQDLRAELVFPVVAQVLAGAPAPNARDARMVQLMAEWRAEGSSRLDRDGDGKIDAPGAAIIDAAWPRIADAVLSPVLGPQLPQLNAIAGADNNPHTGFTGGRVAYVDKDLRTLLGQPVQGAFKTRFCGDGDLAVCRAALWNAIDQAGNELAAAQGPSPDAWRADANAERIHFAPGLLQTTMRYTNRPSGIQQVISFDGHRARR